MAETNYKDNMMQLEKTLEEYFGKKAPALPENIKEILVKFAPYLAILSLIIMLPAILLLLGLGSFATMMAPFGGMRTVGSVPTMWLGIFLLIPTAILQVMAIPGLFARKAIAWKYMYWGELISVVASLIQFNIFGAIIGGAIGFYILFQVRSYYK